MPEMARVVISFEGDGEKTIEIEDFYFPTPPTEGSTFEYEKATFRVIYIAGPDDSGKKTVNAFPASAKPETS